MADVFQKSPFGRGFFDGLLLFCLSHFDFPGAWYCELGCLQREAVDFFEVFGGEVDEAVEEAVFGAFPCDGFLGHFGKAGVVDADLCEGGREAELFLEVFPQALDAFVCDLEGVFAFWGDAHDVCGEAGDAGGGVSSRT